MNVLSRKSLPMFFTRVVILSVIGLLIVSFFIWNSQRRIRSNYRAIDLSHFNETYQKASDNKEDWIEEYVQIALRLSGYQNPDGVLPDNVFTYLVDSENWVVVVSRTTNVFDDSVSGKEVWVELVKSGSIWKVEWAGVRLRCRRDVLFTGWMKMSCP